MSERASESSTHRRRGERLMVPKAEFRSYYGRPVIKPPVWKTPDVPAYLYLGGMAGVAAPLAALGDATGRPLLRRIGRLAAAGGATASVGFLVHDLGVPRRFLNMLRVLKPTSPLSVGSWILAPFGALAGATAVAELTGIAPRLATVTGAAAGLLGPAMTTYTAALLADTAVPAWHDAHRELPFLFAGSAMAAGGGIGMLAADGAGPARRVAVTGALLELAAGTVIEQRPGFVPRAYRTGRAGLVLRTARAVTLAGAVGAAASAVPGRRSRILAVGSGLLLNAAAAATRYGVFLAGLESARDPAYTVVPQRARLVARSAEPATGQPETSRSPGPSAGTRSSAPSSV